MERSIEQIHIQLIFFAFSFFDNMSSFSFIHTEDIHICILRMHGFIGRRPSTYVYVYSFDSFSYYLSFFFSSLSLSLHTVCNLSNIQLYYTPLHICIHICEGYIMFYDQMKGLFKNKRKDCLVIFLFVIFFLPFFWLIANK